jgi:hypothetical protein
MDEQQAAWSDCSFLEGKEDVPGCTVSSFLSLLQTRHADVNSFVNASLANIEMFAAFATVFRRYKVTAYETT